jgi:hypothetical protein
MSSEIIEPDFFLGAVATAQDLAVRIDAALESLTATERRDGLGLFLPSRVRDVRQVIDAAHQSDVCHISITRNERCSLFVGR